MDTPDVPRVLLSVPMKIYGTEWFALINTGSVPNIISRRMVEHLSLSPESTQRRITVADVSVSEYSGILSDLPITFDECVVKLTFLVVEEPPSDVII